MLHNSTKLLILPFLQTFLSQFITKSKIKIFFKLKQKFGEGNGTPLQFSCLENPMGGGAW